MKVCTSLDEITQYVGKKIGVSDWCDITQERINAFADATGDNQGMHVDVDRAQQESSYGGPIAHGFLTLSLAPTLIWYV